MVALKKHARCPPRAPGPQGANTRTLQRRALTPSRWSFAPMSPLPVPHRYTEGRAYRVSGLIPSAADKRGEGGEGAVGCGGSRFSNGRGCSWQQVTLPESARSTVSGLLRRRTLLADAHRVCPDGPGSPAATAINSSVDVAVVVVRVVDTPSAPGPLSGKPTTLTHVFLSDESGGLAVVDVYSSLSTLGLTLKPGTVVTIQDLRCVPNPPCRTCPLAPFPRFSAPRHSPLTRVHTRVVSNLPCCVCCLARACVLSMVLTVGFICPCAQVPLVRPGPGPARVQVGRPQCNGWGGVWAPGQGSGKRVAVDGQR